jgi:hypothetical protein
MEDEMCSLLKNNTWVLVKNPQGQKLIDCKWIFKIKEGEGGDKNVRYKARLVAKGFTQKEGVDYTEIFSPVVKYTTIRCLLALVAHFNWELDQLDVKTAFLYGDLEEEIYMKQPVGFEKGNSEKVVCLLKKSLYGLKQAPRQWYKRFDSFVLKLGFQRSNYDTCLYCRGNGGKNSLYLVLYVDNMLLASYDKSEIDFIKQKLKSEFEMKDLGAAKKILGIQIYRDKDKNMLFLNHHDYVIKILRKFNMFDCKPVTLPLANHFKLSSDFCPKTDEEFDRMSKIPYANVIGSVMYLMVCTRPDLAFSISILSRFMSNPGEEHWNALKWLLRYLKGTSNFGLMFKMNKEGVTLKGFTDSDFAGDRDNRKSTSSYFFTLCGTVISWKSQLQKIVALSSTEAEYIAASDAFKEGIWLSGLLKELGFVDENAILYSDNQSAIHLSKNPMFHDRTKHIDIRYHFIRDIISKGIMTIGKVATQFNPSDMGTKIIPLNKFQNCLKLLSIDTV